MNSCMVTRRFELERRKLEIIWRKANRLAQEHDPFSFESVVLYLIRWEAVYRWTRRDPSVGKTQIREPRNRGYG